jgi:hypothetical protein
VVPAYPCINAGLFLKKLQYLHYTKNAIAQLLQFRHHKLKAMLLQKVTIASIIYTCLIPRKNGTGEVSFVTGWMVNPGGEIKLNTPYGGK